MAQGNNNVASEWARGRKAWCLYLLCRLGLAKPEWIEQYRAPDGTLPECFAVIEPLAVEQIVAWDEVRVHVCACVPVGVVDSGGTKRRTTSEFEAKQRRRLTRPPHPHTRTPTGTL